MSAHFDGQSIQLDEPYKLEPNTKLIVTILPERSAEGEDWLCLSKHQLNNAYSQDDDYPIDAIKTLNPDTRRKSPFLAWRKRFLNQLGMRSLRAKSIKLQ